MIMSQNKCTHIHTRVMKLTIDEANTTLMCWGTPYLLMVFKE
jgi:hypothetical protein